MKTFYLTPYIIKAKSGSENLVLSDLPLEHSNVDLFDELVEILSDLKEMSVSVFDEYQKGLRIKEVFYNENERIIYGLLEGGEYGEEQEIISKETGETTKIKKKNEIPLRPYYFLIYIPKEETKAILILEKISQYGIKTYFEEMVKNKLSERGLNFTLYIHPIILNEVLEEVFKHDVAKIRIIKNKIPFDIADKYELQETEAYEEISFVAKRNKSFASRFFEGVKNKLIRGERINFIEIIPDLNEDEINKIKLEFKLPNNKRRTVSITDIVNIRSDFVLDEIELDDNGFPKFDNIHKEAINLLEVLKETLFEVS